MNTELRDTMQNTIDRFVSPNAEILSIKDQDLAYGTSAVELKRHEILLRNDTRDWSINLISKRASLIERRTLNYLNDQSANVPFSFTLNMTSNSREYLCMQDVDYETDYNNLDIELLQKMNKLLWQIYMRSTLKNIINCNGFHCLIQDILNQY